MGLVVDRYELVQELAVGGMGSVHLGRVLGAVGFSRAVAIKRLHPQYARDPEFVAMFLDEARLAARIRHPNVVSIIDVAAQDKELFLVMDYVHGPSLARIRAHLASKQERMPIDCAVGVAVGVLAGLHAAHEATDEEGHPLHIVHRDVSPQNILLGTDGIARITDFGISKAQGRLQSTTDGRVKGKAAYMAPEQIRGLVDRRTDIFATSVVLWELLTGERLFAGASQEEAIAKVLSCEIPSPRALVPALPAALEEVVMCGLDPNMDQRFSTAREMERALISAQRPANPSEIAEWLSASMPDDLQARKQMLSVLEREGASQRDVAHQFVSSVDQLTTLAASTSAASTPKPARRLPIVALVAIAACVFGVAGALVFTRAASRTEPGPLRARDPAPEKTMSGEPPVSAAKPEPPPLVTSPIATVSTSAAKPPHASVALTAAREAPVKPPPPAPQKPRAGANPCDPPYTVDAQGNRHFIVECL